MLLALTSARRRTRVVAAWLALALLVTDVGLQLRPVAGILAEYEGTARDADLAKLDGLKHEARLVDRAHFRYRVGMRGRVREFLGHANLLSLRRYWGYVNSIKTSYNLQVAANVRYFAGNELEVIEGQAGKNARRLMDGILVFTEYAPLGFWTDRVKFLPDAAQVLEAMDRGEARDKALLAPEDLDAELTARLKALKAGGQGAGWKAAATGMKLQQNSISMSVTAPGAGCSLFTRPSCPAGGPRWMGRRRSCSR